MSFLTFLSFSVNSVNTFKYYFLKKSFTENAKKAYFGSTFPGLVTVLCVTDFNNMHDFGLRRQRAFHKKFFSKIKKFNSLYCVMYRTEKKRKKDIEESYHHPQIKENEGRRTTKQANFNPRHVYCFSCLARSLVNFWVGPKNPEIERIH